MNSISKESSMGTEPSDEQIDAWAVDEQFVLFCDPEDVRDIVRSALQKWAVLALAAPAVQAEPVFHLRSYGDVTEAELTALTARPTAAQSAAPAAQPVAQSATVSEYEPDGYLDHTPWGDFLVYSTATKNRQTALYTLDKARAVLALAAPAVPEPDQIVHAINCEIDTWEQVPEHFHGAMKRKIEAVIRAAVNDTGKRREQAAQSADAVDLSAFDAAVAAELPCVSVVPYNSHEICKWFAKNVRERLSQSAAHPEAKEGNHG